MNAQEMGITLIPSQFIRVLRFGDIEKGVTIVLTNISHISYLQSQFRVQIRLGKQRMHKTNA